MVSPTEQNISSIALPRSFNIMPESTFSNGIIPMAPMEMILFTLLNIFLSIIRMVAVFVEMFTYEIKIPIMKHTRQKMIRKAFIDFPDCTRVTQLTARAIITIAISHILYADFFPHLSNCACVLSTAAASIELIPKHELKIESHNSGFIQLSKRK